jgi:orotidine-5'-phosphate decarboxylase
MKEKLIVGLDVGTRAEAVGLARRLAVHVGALKIGLELLHSVGSQIVDEIQDLTGARIFLDAKLHDIPNTVAGAARALGARGIWMFNVHASGGREMMRRAKEAAHQAAAASNKKPPLVIAVTVLTSIDDEVLANDLGIHRNAGNMVVDLAQVAKAAGMDGVVASPKEVAAVRAACGEGFLIVTPGVRPAWASADDQKRVMTPKEAIALGADYIVVSRPIIKAEDPVDAARRIVEEMT